MLLAQGSTRNVVGSAHHDEIAGALHLVEAHAAAGGEHRNTVRCEVSFASSVDVMVTPARIACGGFGGNQRLAAQHAVLVAEREADDLELAAS